jgi:hypothetical protein
VIREWHLCGKPRTDETRHDFREWSQTLDWIVQNIFDLPPLLEGHYGEQLRISSPALSFLRDVALAVERCNQCGEELSATEIATICDIAGIDIPRCRPEAELEQRSRAIGRLLAPLFKENDKVAVEGFEVTRTIQLVSRADRPNEFQESKVYRIDKKDGK